MKDEESQNTVVNRNLSRSENFMAFNTVPSNDRAVNFLHDSVKRDSLVALLLTPAVS
jgi:hypothetical protein